MNDECKTKEQLVTELTELRQRITDLEATELKYLQLKAQLHERAKELTCIYHIIKVLDDPSLNLQEISQRVVDVLPVGWQYPDVARAKIVISDKEISTMGYRDTKWKLSSDIKVNGVKKGTIEICYLEKKPESDKGPFLSQELLLLSIVAGRIGRVIESKRPR